MYYFLKEDFEALNAEITKLADRIKEIGKEMGESCKEGAETFHDNFAFEDGERQQYMWSSRLRDLIRIRNQARITEPRKTDGVSLGFTVTFRDEGNGEMYTLKIGSFMVPKERGENVISYNSPLARALVGGKVGETREAVIGSGKKNFHILKIE